MKGFVLELAAQVAPSGFEGAVRDLLLTRVREIADEVSVDALGNLLVRKSGQGKHIALVAHMDEPGFLVIHVDDEGFLRIVPIGDLAPHPLVNRPIQFTNGVRGVIGVEHGVKLQELTYDRLYVDIGATSAEEARRKVHVGLAGVVDAPVQELGDGCLAGRALDNRVGCAVALEVFRLAAARGQNVSVVFTAQQTVGARGARVATYQLQPDLAIVIDAAPAGDTPEGPRMDLRIGAGPAVKIMDGTAVVPLAVKDALISSAAEAGVDIQYEVWPRGLSDAGAVQLAVDGTAVGGVSYPARYVGGAVTMVNLSDATAAVQWLDRALAAMSKA
ncbi:aminopeptidase [Alicyclobacillus contaminans]|uniref:M42 family metallopeptidase n=1 Tax=Alicyclobacillus contaminans TaxID=392016 RepID=UPI0003F8331C|nr:M42 family peptidase [Alicyclobacillus contaminans]GMA48684.1 aminopeptidase [Alicyclobacillus contaminans]